MPLTPATTPYAAQRTWGKCISYGAVIPPTADFAILCHGAMQSNGYFDWLSGYLPYGSANEHVLRHYPAVAPQYHGPLYAALYGADPFYHPGALCAQAHQSGVYGVVNYPSVGLIDGPLSAALEQQGFGYQAEITLLSEAMAAGLQTMGLVFTIEQTIAMLEGGITQLLVHPGLINNDNVLYYMESYQEFLLRVSSITSDNIRIIAVAPSGETPEQLAQILPYNIQSICV